MSLEIGTDWIAIGTRVVFLRPDRELGERVVGRTLDDVTHWLRVGDEGTVTEVHAGWRKHPMLADDVDSESWAVVAWESAEGGTQDQCIHPSDEGRLWRRA